MFHHQQIDALLGRGPRWLGACVALVDERGADRAAGLRLHLADDFGDDGASLRVSRADHSSE